MPRSIAASDASPVPGDRIPVSAPSGLPAQQGRRAGRLAAPTTVVRWARLGLRLTAWALVFALLAQLFTVGMAVFANPAWWARHLAFVHWFEWLTPLALVLAIVGRTPRVVQALAALAVALLWLQYTTADFRLAASTRTWAALHPIAAVLLFWTATEIARRAAVLDYRRPGASAADMGAG